MKTRVHKPLRDFSITCMCACACMCGGQKTPRSQSFLSRGPGVELGSIALHGKCFYTEPSPESEVQVSMPVPSR